MATSLSTAIVISQSSDGMPICFSPDVSKIIIGTDVKTWLSSTAFTNGDQNNQLMDQSDAVCPVCLENIAPREKLSMFACRHVLHFTCAHLWINNCIQKYRPAPCPLCNFIIIHVCNATTQLHMGLHALSHQHI